MTSAPQSPHRVSTFVFTDLERSTAQWEADADAMDAALARHDAIMLGAVATHDGAIFSTGGDGYAMAFADPVDALAAIVEFQQSLADEPWADGIEMRVRVGVHVGAARERAGNYFGPVVIRAARLEQIAHGGQVLLSAATAELVVDAGFAIEPLGDYRLKGLDRAEHVHQLAIPGLRSSFPPLRAASGPASNLPAAIDQLVGRSADLSSLIEDLADHRLVTLVGPGGVGKTTLAVAAGHQLLRSVPDGVWFVDLAPLADDQDVEVELAAALGVHREARPPIEAVIDRLASASSLVVFDNCEHLIDAVASVVDALLGACPDARVLATSREPLGVRAEGVRRLASLSDDDAASLFLRRAGAAGSDVDDLDRETVAAVCRRLDNVPLALELAASRVRTMSITDLASRLDDRFRLLTGGARTALPRQRTLEAAIAWSFDLLDAAEQRDLIRLAVFPGGFSLAAAEEVCGSSALDSVASLVDKSLIDVDGAASRYRMLETIRAFARERLSETNNSVEARNAQLRWAVSFSTGARRGMNSGAVSEAMESVAAELDNLRAAMGWALEHAETARGQIAEGLQVASNLFEFWDGHGAEGHRWMGSFTAAIDGSVPPHRAARAWLNAGNLAARVGDVAVAANARDEARQRFLDLADEANADVARFFAIVDPGSPDEERDLESIDECCAILDRCRTRGDRARFVWLATWLLPILDVVETDEAFERLLDEFRSASEDIAQPRSHAHTTEYRGGLFVRKREMGLARRWLADAVDEYEAIGIPLCSTHCLLSAAFCLSVDGAIEPASVLLGAADTSRRRYGWGPGESRFELRAERLGIQPVIDEDARAEGKTLTVDDALFVARTALTA